MSSLRLTTQLQQKMVLTPQLRQRIEMLQMNSLELSELIEQEVVANPILEEVQPGEEVQEIGESILDQNSDGLDHGLDNDGVGVAEVEGVGAGFDAVIPEGTELNGNREAATADSDGDDEGRTDAADAFDEIDYGREFQDYLDPGYRTQEIEYKDYSPSFEQFLTHSPTLSEHLESQLVLLSLPDSVNEAAIQVIGNLDEDGRLSASIEEIAESCKCSLEVVESARVVVMQLDPVGCGARDVKECLVAQLRALGEGSSLASTLVEEHFEDLQPHRLQHLAKSTGVEIHALDEEINKIRQLDPYPGRRYSSDEAIFVSPEVYIEKLDEDYVIYFADDGTARLRISPTYHTMLDKSDTTKETKDFIKEKVRSAVDLLRNIEHRRQTIYRVVECIVSRQRDFLDKGVEHIKPMMLKDIAEDIGMHLSTISRVVNRKYAHTPQGVIELRRFFSEGMLNEEGEEVSTRILKLRIKKMVEDEDTRSPLTDDQIAKILSKEGVKLSRRTVAKYRDQMNIPGSRERKNCLMKIEFTGRHIEVTPALKAHVEEQFAKIQHVFDGKPAKAHVIIEVERGRHRAEIIINWRNESLTAVSTNSDMYQSLSQTVGKIEKQARKLKDKVIDKSHRATKAAAIVSEPVPVAEKAAKAPAIIEMKGFATKPMSPDEAAMGLDGGKNNVLMFRDSESGGVGVIFRRDDGNYGLIRSA